jgi:2-hydroxy-6-oxonona-2,4-dienedioate hydrolase
MTTIRTLEWTVAGRRTRILEAGSSSSMPVVLVHGLGLSADVWRPHMRILAAAGQSVYAPDLPGCGRSEGPMLGMGVPDGARWLVQLRAALALPPAVWVGHSVAAQTTVHLAARWPDVVAGLVLATPTGERGRLRWLAQLAGLARTTWREPAWLVRDVLRHYLTTNPSRTIGTWLRSRSHDPLGDAARVRAPALVFVGRNDPVVPLAFARRLCAALAQGRLVELDEAAHGAALSASDAFSATLLDFASGVTTTTHRAGEAGAAETAATTPRA